MPLGALPIRGEILRPSRGPHTPLALPGREVWTGFCGFCIGIIRALIIPGGNGMMNRQDLHLRPSLKLFNFFLDMPFQRCYKIP